MSPFYGDFSSKRKRLALPAQLIQTRTPAPLSMQTVQRAQTDPNKLTSEEVASLQRSVGNAAVARMLGGGGQSRPPSSSSRVQRKLNVGPVDDRYEREADQIAQSVQGTSSSRTSASIQRDPVGPEGGPLQGDIEGRLRQTQGSGSPLPDTVRSKLEPKLSADLSPVKVHTDKQAVQLTQELGAKAFTHKNHIYYGEGHSPNDLKLTAHESVHTIQQGAVSQSAQRLPDEEVSLATKAVVSRAPAHIQRWDWWDKRKARKKNMSDADVVNQTTGEGGSANRVDKVTYNRNIGKSKEKSGFFKPNMIENPGTRAQKENVGMANRAVASSRLDKWLGTNVLAEEVWASHNGENGSVSAKVAGSPLYENQFNTPMGNDFDIDMALDPTQYKNVNGQYHQQSGQHFNYHDFSNPATQKGSSDLQLLDAITGQSDRHGGNIYVDDASGQVKGIDNDIAFGKGEDKVDVLSNKYHGLPSQVDKKTAKKILKKKAKNLPKALGSKHGGSLTDKEIQAAQARLREVKQYLKGLKKDKKLVKNWDDTTYLKSYLENDRTDKWGNSQMEPSYAKRSLNQYANANDRGLPPDEQLMQQIVENPLYGQEEELF